jgi:beta-phosphoglucomutase
MEKKGILFDMDGVLVDSEKFICQAAIKMFSEIGAQVTPEDFLPFIGTGEGRYIGGVAEKYQIPFDQEVKKKRTYEIYEQMIQGELMPIPGVVKFISRLREHGLKIAVATSADERKMRVNLQEIGLPPESFDAVVTGKEVARKKPFPDIYLEAAKRIDVNIKDCIVVEDAVNGVQAAKSAGAVCLALTGSFSREELSLADWIVADFTQISDKLFEAMIKSE